MQLASFMPLIRQLVRYAVVGGVSLGVDVGLFLLSRSVGLDLVSCNVLARLAGAVTAYTGNFLWTFSAQSHARFLGATSVRYAVLWVVSTALSTLALGGLIHLGLPEAVGKLCVELSMPLLNFAISRLWVFR